MILTKKLNFVDDFKVMTSQEDSTNNCSKMFISFPNGIMSWGKPYLVDN